MKHVSYLCILFFFSVLLISCSEKSSDETSYLTVTPETISFPASGGSESFKISCNTSWSITIPEGSSIWITTTNGTGDRELQISLPATKNVKETELRLLIKSADNRVANLVVKQEGMLLTGGTLDVTNHMNVLFGGNAHDMDSVQILCNIPWKVYGPEWLEASIDGKKWTTLSSTRAMIEGGSFISEENVTELLLLRTKSTNTEEDNYQGTLKLAPAYDNTADIVELGTAQLGRHYAAANSLTVLANELVCDFKCGLDVTKIYFHISDHMINTQTEAIEWDGYTLPNYINSWDELEEDHIYYLYVLGKDAANGYYNMTYNGYQTLSSKNQAIASIQNVNYDGSKWTWATKMNSNCVLYAMWKTYNEDYFDYTDGMLAWFLSYMMHNHGYEGEDKEYCMYTADITYSWKLDYHMQLVTWGAGGNGNHLAGVIDRYRSIDHYQAPNRAASRHIHAVSAPRDIDAFKKAFVRIK